MKNRMNNFVNQLSTQESGKRVVPHSHGWFETRSGGMKGTTTGVLTKKKGGHFGWGAKKGKKGSHACVGKKQTLTWETSLSRKHEVRLPGHKTG